MKEKNMRFGAFMRKKRIDDPRSLTINNIADHLGLTTSYISYVENSNKKPYNGEILEKLAVFLNLTEVDTALMYNLAGKESRTVPYDLEDILMYEDVGELILYATRLTKAGYINEEDWKMFIRQKEEKKQGGCTSV